MNKLISLCNRNRKAIMTVVGVLLAVFILIQLLNKMAKNELKKQNDTNTIITSGTNTIVDKSANTVQTESVLDDSKISENKAESNQDIINNFIEYCNNGKVTDAYSLISDDCKSNVLKTEEDFKSRYIDIVFTNQKQYNIQNLYSSELGTTYRITYINDALSTGVVGTNIEDYLTVKNGKISLYRYIGHVDVNQKNDNGILSVVVKDRNIYDEYEEYNLEISNLSNNPIMINRHEDNGGIYAIYDNSQAYKAIISETYSGNLALEAGQTKYIKIKINKMYNGDYKVKSLNLTDIINNKQIFDSVQNKSEYTDISKLEIIL